MAERPRPQSGPVSPARSLLDNINRLAATKLNNQERAADKYKPVPCRLPLSLSVWISF